eukprot:jgi/Mesvir1/26800/Mv20567-RA.1
MLPLATPSRQFSSLAKQALRAVVLVAGGTGPVTAPQLYTGSQDGTVRVWDCNSGQCSSCVPMGVDVHSVLLEGGYLFVGLSDVIKCWNMSTSTQMDLLGHEGAIHTMCVANDMLLSGAQDMTIRAWKFNPATATFALVATLTGHTGPVQAMQAMAGRLYSGSWDKSIKVWDLNSGQLVQSQANAHDDVIMGLQLWQGHLLSCSLDGSVKVWSINPSGALELAYKFVDSEDATPGVLAICGVVDASQRPVLLTAYNDNSVKLYELPAFTERGSLFCHSEARVLSLGPAGMFFTGEKNGMVKVWRWTAEAT